MNATRHALVRAPARSLLDACELTHLPRTVIEAEAIDAEHAQYVAALQRLGLDVTCLPAREVYPDSVFMEDAALVLDEVLILTQPTASRAGESEVLLVDAGTLGRPVRRIQTPGTLEGGDVLRIGRHLLVGLTTRTNLEGFEQLRSLVEPFGYTVSSWSVHGALHFKTACTALDDTCLLINPDWVDGDALRAAGFETVLIDASEPFAANVLRVGDAVLANQAFPETLARIRAIWAARGHDEMRFHLTHLSEFGKAEAGLTCLSLVYAMP